MARITVEDCLKKVNSRFELVHLAIKRVKELKKGAPPLVECDNKEVVTALREIAAGKIYPVRFGEQLPQAEEKELPEPAKEILEEILEVQSEETKSEEVGLEDEHE